MIIFLHMVKRRSLYRNLFIGGGKDKYKVTNLMNHFKSSTTPQFNVNIANYFAYKLEVVEKIL